MKVVRQKVVISGTNPAKFLLDLQEAIHEGACIDENDYPRITSFPYFVTMYIEGPASDTSWHWTSNHCRNVFPVKEEEVVYNEQTISELDWETFRRVVGAVGIKGRDRNKMTKEYFAIISENIAE